MSANKKSRSRDVLRNLALSLFAVVLTLGLLEIGVRLFAPVPLVATDLFLQVPPSVQARSARRTLMPGVSCRHVAGEFNVAVRINAKGLRDVERPYAKPPGVIRVLAIGDSFTFGYGVKENERFTNLLQAWLNAHGKRHYEVINAGVPSWGTEDELLFWREEGRKYHPDIVLLCFYRNDVHDNLERDLFAMHGSALVDKARRSVAASRAGTVTRDPFNDQVLSVGTQQTAPVSAAPHPSWLIQHSHLARMVRLALFRRSHQESDAPRERTRQAQQLTALLFDAFARETGSSGARFKLCLIPDKSDFTRRGTLGTFPLLQEWEARQPPGHVLDLLPVLSRDASPTDLYFQRDAHLNAHGHAVAAAALETFVRTPTR